MGHCYPFGKLSLYEMFIQKNWVTLDYKDSYTKKLSVKKNVDPHPNAVE